MKRTACFVFCLSLLITSALTARLKPIDFEEFYATATCGLIGTVKSVTTVPETRYGVLDVLVVMAVENVFAKSDCRQIAGEFQMWFSSEMHSSHPKVGERALVFPSRQAGPRRSDEDWFEVVYGRSYWLLRAGESGSESEVNVPMVVVSGWNDFLRQPLGLQRVIGEELLVSLTDLEDL